MRLLHVSPREAVLAVLRARFGNVRGTARQRGLTVFQHDAVDRLRAILDCRRGAILADSVGLGKTHVARALATPYCGAAGVLICAPAQLRRHWQQHMRGCRGWQWLSHTSLSRGTMPAAAPALVIVDEAHAFRNPVTRRYRTLSAIAAHTRLLLLTATPVNNRIDDFLHLVRLFAPRDAFADIGVVDLHSAAAAANAGDPAAIRRVADAVVVRRTRTALAAWTDAEDRSAIHFPAVDGVHALRYALTSAQSHALQEVLELLEQVRFSAHAAAGGAPAIAYLLKLGLLKRLESGVHAFDASVARQLRIITQFADAAVRGLLFTPRSDARLLAPIDGATQLPLSELLYRPWPPHLDRAALTAAAAADAATLRRIRCLTRALSPDPKETRLRELLLRLVRDGKVVVFSEFRDTAVRLWQVLSRDFAAALIHGHEARLGRQRAARSTVVERFAPRANGAAPPRHRERVAVLIATDVIAEGMNLQDARSVVSYDLPWNPVRLAQRIGRIDRLGSQHDRIVAYAFRPGEGVEELLGMMRRLRRKLHGIRIVGGDAPRLRNDRDRDDDAALLAAETLRRLHRAHAQAAPGAQPLPAAGGVCVAAARSAQPGGLLTCWRAGTAVRVFRTETGRTRELAHADADPLLLEILDAPAAPLPTTASLRAAARGARALLRRAPAAAAARTRDAPRRVARQVHHWLRELPGGPSPEQAAIADSILRALPGLTNAQECALLPLLRTAARDELVHRAHELIAAADGPVAAPRATASPRLIAVICLVHASSAGPSGEIPPSRAAAAPAATG